MSNPYDPYGQQPPNPYGGGGGSSFDAPGAGGFEQKKTDGVSIAALVTGLICCAPVSFILGIVGIRRTKGGQRKGRGLAITGLVLGIIGLLVWIGTAIAAVAGVAWFDSLLLPEEAEVGQCMDVTEEDGDVLLYEKECTEDHDAEVVAVVEVDADNKDEISDAMTNYCAEAVDPEDLVKLNEVEGLEYNAVIEDPNNVDEGDHLVCYVESSDKLDEPIL